MKRIMCLLPIIMVTSCSLGNKEGNSGISSFIEPLDSLNRSDSILGDLNGDGEKEYAWYVSKGDRWAIENKDRSKCFNYIEFSNPDIPSLLTNYWFSKPINEGDLNNDGKDEIGAIVFANPEIGNWHKYHVWILHNSEWKNLIEPFPIFSGYEDLNKLVRIDSINKGKVIIRYNEWDELEGVITKEKSVNMQF